jgi:ABC-type transport system involved in multi-copper enzyme maturation permease subunit
MLLALMLSTVTKSTATSVGISIATYVGSGTIMSIINAFVTMDFVKFIPFNNLSLVDKIFPNSVSYITMQNASTMLNQVSVGFSLVVLGVCTVLMLTTMFDSFNKRDII